MTGASETDARAEAAALYRALGQSGLCAGSAGNVSLRTEGGMLVTPSGARPETVTPGCLVSMDLDGRWRAPRPLPASG